MDAPTPQPWGLGIKPKLSMNLPPSFVIFFPARDFGTSSHGKIYPGPRNTGLYEITSWVGILRAPVPFQTLPAWHRIATESFPDQNNVTRTIMKRISHPTPRVYGKGFLWFNHAETVAAARFIESWLEPTLCKLPSKKSRRLESFQSTDCLAEFCGQPNSKAEMARIILEAKVIIANGLLALDQSTISKEMKFLGDIFATSTIPAKRSLNKKNCIEQDGLFGGYKLLGYMEVVPIVKRAATRGNSTVTLLEASIASVASRFADIKCRRDLRVPLAAIGEPYLDDILDKTETSSLLSFAKTEDESGKSPTKRSLRHIEDIIDSPRRLSDSVVELLPASTPRIESSPVKPHGTPSTPFIDSPSAPVDTPGRLFSPVPLPSFAPGPTLHFTAPAYDSSSSMEQTIEQVSSPIKASLLVAQTPTKVANTEAITPYSVTTPQQTDNSDLGLVASIPASLPRLVPTGPVLPVDTTQLSFGPFSPSFNSASWVDDTVSTRPKRAIKQNGRRKSEPLLRSCIRSQAARRQTISPRKYVFENEAVLNAANSPSPSPAPDHDDATHIDVDRTPEQLVTSEPNLNMMTPAISWGRMTGRVSGDGVESTSGYNRAVHMKGVHKVDMRQNPDIFGAPAISSSPSPPSINRLADMAVDRCDGQAKVQVTEENGKLFVRFKLPTEYAYLFPNSQGMDESHFTSTPSVISSSPRITLKSREMTFTKRGISPQVGRPASPALARGQDATLIVSDFITSPTVHSAELTSMPAAAANSEIASATNSSEESNESSLSDMDHTPTITAFNISGRSVASHVPTPSKQAGNKQKATAPVSTPTGTPTLNTSFTPVNRFGFRERTSSVSASPKTAEITQRSTEQGENHIQPNNYEDSPGRDYMRDFIKRTSHKRTSTTAAGSPIAPPAKRAPLGIKSPNVESPHKGKRKAQPEEVRSISSLEAPVGPVAKKARRAEKPSPEQKSPAPITMMNTNAAATGVTAGNKRKCDEQIGSGARRSTRLRSQQPVSTAKSSIPTPIKLGGRSGAGRGTLSSTTRSEEKVLSNKTRKNTLKNRGNAEYPAQVLARYQEEQLGDSGEENRGPGEPTSATSRKTVGWRTPLEEAKKTRATRATRSSTRVRK